jgi:hypothetical protein
LIQIEITAEAEIDHEQQGDVFHDPVFPGCSLQGEDDGDDGCQACSQQQQPFEVVICGSALSVSRFDHPQLVIIQSCAVCA